MIMDDTGSYEENQNPGPWLTSYYLQNPGAKPTVLHATANMWQVAGDVCDACLSLLLPLSPVHEQKQRIPNCQEYAVRDPRLALPTI